MPSTVLRIVILCLAVVAVAASAASAGALSSSRFKAIDAVYAAIEPINASSTKPTPKQLSRVTAACAKLDPMDGLLRSQKRVCGAGVTFLRRSAAVKCASKDACVRELGGVISALQTLLSASRADNKVIDALVDARQCRKAMRTSASDLTGYETVLRGFRQMRSGLRDNSQSEYNRGEQLVARVDISSERDSRAVFRTACG